VHIALSDIPSSQVRALALRVIALRKLKECPS